MITKNRPFQVACWALMMALGLSCIVALTDPRSVRLAILAHAEQDAAAANADAVLIADAAPTTSSVEHDDSASAPSLAFEVAPHQLSASTLHPQPTLADRSSTPRVAFRSPLTVDSQAVSSRGELRRNDLHSDQRPSARTRFVVSPDQLQSESSRSSEVEFLPPPPEVAHEVQPWEPSALAREERLPARSEPIVDAHLNQRWLEMELLSLRQEVQRLAEAQLIAEQLDRLQQQQQQLISMHENLPNDRLLEVIDLLHQQLTMVRETFPPPPRDPQSPAVHSVDETSQMIGEVSTSGNGRVSLKITDAELDDILSLLERITGTPLGKLPSAQLMMPVETPEAPQSSLPTASKPTVVQPLSYEQPLVPEPSSPITRASRCASCHQGSTRP